MKAGKLWKLNERVSGWEPMRYTSILVLILLLGCSPRTTTTYLITNDTLYGDISRGRPGKDSLITVRRDGVILGEGHVAVTGKHVSNIKVGEWKEYNDGGILVSIGSYNIGSFLDCCVAGYCRVFYYYRTGQWKYFNSKGEIDCEVDFEPTRLTVDTRCSGADTLVYGLIKVIPRDYQQFLTTDKINEIQKLKFVDDDGTTTYTPLNGELKREYTYHK